MPTSLPLRRIRRAVLPCAVPFALAAALVVAAAPAGAQTASDAAPAAAALPPELARVVQQPVAQQTAWLKTAARDGALDKLDDATLTALFTALDPMTVPAYIAAGPNGYPSYEFTMTRQERIGNSWASRPDHMIVKMTREPLRIYAKWLPDGAHSGQEAIYDETKRKDEMYGHLGGLLGKFPLWTSLTGTLARAQSNHTIRDLGTEYITALYLSEGKKYDAAGVSRPSRVEAKTIDGVRVVALTYETPTGRPQFYAKKETLGLDLRHPYFRTVESYDNDGTIFERIVFEKITPKSFDDSAFDPKNPDYKY
jgi:outer membrane lipoprotein-sorting protein